MGEVWSKQWAELVDGLPIEQAVHVRAVTEEWCEELTGHVDELSFPVYQHRGAVVVAAVKLGDDPEGDTIAVHERSDTLGPLVGPDDLFVFRWVSPPVPVPDPVREVLRGG